MKKLSGAIISFLLLSLLFSLGAFPIQAQALPKGQVAPLNPAFEKRIEELRASAQEGAEASNFGYLPSVHDWSHLTIQSLKERSFSKSDESSFPSSFDLRSLGKVPPVRNQGSYGTCWAFATFGSLESFLLPSESWDFSEDNLINTSGFDPDPYNGGGNCDMATAYLARWSGPVREDQDPYPSPGFVSFPPSKHVQEVFYLPPRLGPLDNNTIKSALMSYGGVYTAIYWHNSYYNSSKASYYYSGSAQSNHAVVIVGWNDDYQASNFLSPPPGNGAFIVRNSWGPSFGENGYFYVSYYDSWIGRELAVFNNAESTSNYANIYQYDPLGWTASYGYGSNTAWFANRFSAQSEESLKAVSFYTASLNSSYEIYLGSSLSSLQFQCSGTIGSPGYHTVTLPNPISLSSGQNFFLAVKLTTPGYSYPIPVEMPISGYSSRATASSGESFVSLDGVIWRDLTSEYSNTNVCLKAFTVGGSTPPPEPLLSVSPESLDFGSEMGQLSFTLRNDGGGTLQWSASESIPWVVSISPASGTLSAGESANVTVTVQREGLSPGNYSGSISLTSNGGNKVIEVKMAVVAPDFVTITNLPANVETQEHQAVSFQVQASDSRGHSLSFSLISGPGSINSSTGLYTWSNPSPVGEYVVLIRAFCSQGASDEEELIIKVNPPPSPPTVLTQNPSGVSESQVTLNGSANPNGWPTEVWFEWGTTTSYGNSTPTQNIGSGTSTVPFSFTLGSLNPSTTYHFRAVAQNQHGTSYGLDQAITTLPLDTVSILNLPQKIETVKGHAVSFQVQASDSRGHSLSFSLISGPGSINSSTGLYTWSNPSPIGEFQSLIRVTCSGGKWDEKILTIKVREEISTFTYSLNSGWNLISLPLVTDPNPNNVFQGIKGNWVIFSWDPATGSYRMNEQVSLAPGAGYWIKIYGGEQMVTITGSPYGGSSFSISLLKGWNTVGNPFLNTLSMSSLKVISQGGEMSLEQAMSQGILSPFFLWDPTMPGPNGPGGYVLVDASGKFLPGRGYWVKTNQNCTLVVPNVPPSP